MKLFEFEGKKLFDRAGIKTPPGKVVASPAEAAGLVGQFGPVMAKAQVLRGKRGKEHAIIACENESQATSAIGSLLGRKLSDETVERVLVEQKLDIAQEVYASVTYVGTSPAVILSASGGIDIETAAHESQDNVVVEPVNILRGLDLDKAADMARRAGLDAGVADVLVKLYKLFAEIDATLVEINPLVRTGSGEWIAADAKIEIDEDAMYRQAGLKLPDDLARAGAEPLGAACAGQ